MAGLLVHEWFARAGGSENVVQEFVKAFPDADLFVLWNDRGPEIAAEVFESWLAATPLRKHKAAALPFMPATWRMVKPRQRYDWALISSHLFAHHIRLRGSGKAIPKLVYAHTPARYIWAPEYDERGSGLLPRLASTALRPLDRRRAQEATAVAANSRFTQKRIERCWGLEARVIYPPVNVTAIQAVSDWSERLTVEERAVFDALPAEYLLGASRFVAYKRLDLVIRAGEVAGVPVVLAGGGPSQEELAERAAQATVPVTFVDWPRDEMLYALYQNARAYIFPAIEDFGIMPIEAMALGTPVIVPEEGGASEGVTRLAGGVAIPAFSPAEVQSALASLEQIDRQGLSQRVQVFSQERFRAEIAAWLEQEVG